MCLQNAYMPIYSKKCLQFIEHLPLYYLIDAQKTTWLTKVLHEASYLNLSFSTLLCPSPSIAHIIKK